VSVKIFLFLFFLTSITQGIGQKLRKGRIVDYFLDVPVAKAKVSVVDTQFFVTSDSLGHFEMTLSDTAYILIEAEGYRRLKVKIPESSSFTLNIISLKPPPEEKRFYSVVDEGAQLIGGMSIHEYVLKSFRFWDRIKTEGVAGRVEIEIRIDENGNVMSVKLLKGIAQFVDDEILRIVRESHWKPAVLEYRNVKTKHLVSFLF